MRIAQTKLDALQREAEKRGMAHSRQGNLEHTARHGVSASEIEYLFYNDPPWSALIRIRPISARYMHKKEIESYEQR